uniref:ATP synthase F0 subunit 6 n=1 Tax=Atkinsoniella xanthoabdomena TaxID=2930063 RepID=UPI0020006FE8|nr:ATP synthase F0 subunit 6 [Atkinsoniella xanthoabdomena]UNZ12669.1 ATP synthase F0 subunit 6 [Atkinsoniella xanthoabdomena]
MMTNLFSVFDPCTGILSMNWISIMIYMWMFPKHFWFLKNKNIILINILLMKLHSELISLMKYKGMSLIMVSMFIMILFNNIMGLLPYIFTASSHLVFSISLALPMWMGFMIYGWVNNTNHMFTHLVPIGTPFILMPFMVLIETISNLIRPGSLAVRLTANMIAGHLLMSLLGNNVTNITLMISCMILFIILMMFETAVALIQSYVFMTLTNLYSSEV